VFYRFVKSIVSVSLSLFYRLEVTRQVQDVSGPVLFVGNHPNSLIDPAIVLATIPRQITFLAKEPLFRVPLFGWLLKALGALPVFRKLDHPTKMENNAGTLQTAAKALMDSKAITIFPEGISHSAPQIADLKTGCARIALLAARGGGALRIVPVGLTYAQKTRFRSRVQVEIGDAILVESVSALSAEDEHQWVQHLTERVDEALRNITLNLETWEDVSVIETADKLLSLKGGHASQEPARLRLLAKAAKLLRAQDPEHFSDLKDDILAYRSRLDVLSADPNDLQLEPKGLVSFVVRNLGALLFGFPLFALGLFLFFIPFVLVSASSKLLPLATDRIATFKLMATLLVASGWWTFLTASAAIVWGTAGMLMALFGSLPLALFTRYFLEHWRTVLADAVTFAKIGSRKKLRLHVLAEGERLQEELSTIAERVGAQLGRE
jgi:glycerol-3-phosphate O-acyltransferase / dihydroxyacetone phosphate acyltransferase